MKVVFALLAAGLIGSCGPAPGEPAGVSWSEPVEVASGKAHQGPWRMNDSQFHYVDDPTVAIHDGGPIAVAWVDQSRRDVFLDIYTPGGAGRFDAPVNVSNTPEIFSWLPRMIVAGDDASLVYLLWQEIVFSGGTHGGEIFFARSSDGGGTFRRPLNLSNSSAGDGKGRLTRRYWHNGSLDLAIGPAGTLYAAWTEYEGALWFSRSTDGGATFSPPLRVGGEDALPARGPALAVADANTVYLAWTVGEDPRADIRLAGSQDAGKTFSAPRIVVESEGHCDAPKITVDPKGKLHLVYGHSPEGPFGRYEIRHTRSSDGAQTFTEPQVISGPLSQRYASSSFPSLGADGEGRLYVLWELFGDPRGRPRGLGFTVSRDAGDTFAPPAPVPGSDDPLLGHNGSRQGLLMSKLAVEGSGMIAVVNSTFKAGEASRVWLFRAIARDRDPNGDG